MDGQIKRPKWTSTATIGLILLIVIISAVILFIRAIIPDSAKKVLPQMSEVSLSLTQSQQNEILTLVTPAVEACTDGFYSVDAANKNELIDAAILHILSGREKMRMDGEGYFMLSATEVTAEYNLMFGEMPEDIGEYESEKFFYDADLGMFYIYGGYDEEQLAGIFADKEYGNGSSSNVSEDMLVEIPEDVQFIESDVSILSARSVDGTVVVTVLVSNAESERKMEVSIRDNGGYVLMSMIDI